MPVALKAASSNSATHKGFKRYDWKSSSTQVQVKPTSFSFSLITAGQAAGNSSVSRRCQEAICISMNMLWLEDHVTMESVCLELGWGGSKRFTHTKKKAPEKCVSACLRGREFCSYYNLLASVCDSSERTLGLLSGVPRVPSLLAWLDSWDPTVRQFGNKEEAYNLWGSVWNEKPLELLDGNARRRLVTQDFKNACSVTLFPSSSSTLSLFLSQEWFLLQVV